MNAPLIQTQKSLYHKTKQWKTLKNQRANLWIELAGNWLRKQKMIIVIKEVIGWKDKEPKNRKVQDSKCLTKMRRKKREKRKIQIMNIHLLNKLWWFKPKVKLRKWLVILLVRETQMKWASKRRIHFLEHLVLKDLCIGILVLFRKWNL